MENKRILFVNTHFIPDYHFGGVVESGSKIYKYLKKITPNISLVTVSKEPKRVYKFLENNEKCYKSIIAHRWGFSLDLIFGLWKQIQKSDILFINGTVTFPTVLAQIYALLRKKPFIVSIRGTFGEQSLKQKKWKKLLFYNLIVIPLLKQANKIHVTSLKEKSLTEIKGIKNIFLVSNGIDLEQYNNLPNKYNFNKIKKDKFVFLFMSRMDKEKGLDILIEAYKKFIKENKNYNSILLLVGPDNQNYLKSLKLNFNKFAIKYINGIYGDKKIEVIRRADVVVLPSYNENFGNIIAEGLVCERPVITTTGTPWKDIEKIGCGYYIKPNKNELFKTIQKIYNLSNQDREQMGKLGREYIVKNFNWKIKAQEIYNKIMELK